MAVSTQKTIIIAIAVLVIVIILSCCASLVVWIFTSNDSTPPVATPPDSNTTPPVATPLASNTTPPANATPPEPINSTPPSVNDVCTTGYQTLFNAHDLAGYDISFNKPKTLDECLDMCTANEKCDWVSYSAVDKQCNLKSWSTKIEEGASTFVRLENDSCDYIQYQGSSVPDKMTGIGDNPVKNVGNAKACATICRNTPGCDAANYEEKDGDCELYKGPSNNYRAYVATWRMKSP